MPWSLGGMISGCSERILLGIVGSVVGGLTAGGLTVGLRGFHPAGWIGSIIGAIIVLVIYNKVTGRKSRARIE